jgi:small subunit ribosomal protein S10
MYTVNIHISGYDPTNLERANFWLMKLAQKCKGEDINGWPLPKRRHLITVLRSPHVNKKSREQFFETTRGRMFVGQYNPKLAQVFVQLVEQTHLPGVELSMKVLQPTVFPNFYCIYIK